MKLDFYHRSLLQLTDDNVRTIVGGDRDVQKQGYTVDRLKPIVVERYGTSYWKYAVPVMQVTN